MRIAGWMLLLMSVSFSAFAADATGTWRVTFTDPQGERPKMVSEMTFEITTVGDKLVGKAHIGNWPGDGPLVDGKIDGNRISFTVYGNSPWWSRGPTGEASGLPKLVFAGTLDGDRMRLNLVWDSVMIYGKPGGVHELHLAGSRVSR